MLQTQRAVQKSIFAFNKFYIQGVPEKGNYENRLQGLILNQKDESIRYQTWASEEEGQPVNAIQYSLRIILKRKRMFWKIQHLMSFCTYVTHDC